MTLSSKAQKILTVSNIVCGAVPDGFAFVDGKLNTWDNFMRKLSEGLGTFNSIKVSPKRYADLIGSLEDYE